MIGVYKIENKVNGKCYIGSSIKIESRWVRHKKDLRNNSHHSIILQRAYNKYGLDSFKFSVIEVTSYESITEREQYYLEYLEPVYNISKFASHPTKGRKKTEEQKAKMRKYALDNNIKPPETAWKSIQRKVTMCDYNTNVPIKDFESISEACRYLGLTVKSSSAAISKAAMGQRYSANKYKWTWTDGDRKNLLREL